MKTDEPSSIKVQNRNQFMRLCIVQVGENMSRLPLEAETLVVKLMMTAFDAGHNIATSGEAEIDL